MARPHTGYLYQRPGSTQWWIRFRYPAELGIKTVQKSLKTPDRKEAEVIALPLIAEHRRRLYDAEQRRKGFIRASEMDLFYPLGASVLEDGTKVYARMDIVEFERDGRTWEEENFLTVRTVMRPVAADPDWVPPAPKPKKAVDNDIEHVERWIKHRDINPFLQSEAREAFRLFKDLTGGKLFRDADRDDGRKLVDHLFNVKKNKRATVQKKISHLAASVNLAMSEGKLKFNPFSAIIPDIEDAEEREPMPEADVKLIRENRSEFKRDEEWLLYMLCCTTGMRREEAYQIDREYEKDGIRFAIIRYGKNLQSTRRVPFPDAVLKLLPAKITEPLFDSHLKTEEKRKAGVKNLGRQVLRRMERIGVTTPGLHTLRHRAKDRMREADITHDQQEEVLGHERKTVADTYGKGYPVRKLKEWIEKIGH